MKPTRFFTLLTALIVLILTNNSCSKSEDTNTIILTPVAILTISPTSGSLTTVFTFDGSASRDGNNSAAGLMYRWDGDSDGIWDIDWTSSSVAQVTYNVAGTFLVTMQVQNASNRFAVDSKLVIVTDGGGGQIPTVTTDPVSNITQTTATTGGNVVSQGSSAVQYRGVCYSTAPNPTTSDTHTTDGTSTGSFTSTITGLSSSTSYYVRAYATNTAGTAYGNQQSFTTSGGGSSGEPCPGIPTITDSRDGQVYPTVKIGSQCWLQKNMNYETGNSWCYENKPINCAIYGRLYDWDTFMNGASSSNAVPSGVQGVCPPGWHVPSDPEWDILINYLGGVDVAGGKMKEAGTDHWSVPNTGATNSSGFTALPGGYRDENGFCGLLTKLSYFWTSTESSSTRVWYRDIYYNNDDINRPNQGKGHAFSARCVKD